MAFFIKKTQRHGGTEKNNTFSEDTEKKLCVSVTLCLIKYPRDSVFIKNHYSASAAKRRSSALSASPSASLSRVTNFEPMIAPAALA